MRLIGMLDSPYVRRTAVALETLGVPFRHEAVSVFVDFDRFQQLNPVVKAPTFLCDDGTVLMDSSLIIDYAQSLDGPAQRLWPWGASDRAIATRAVGLALAACDKAVQLIYERNLRPADKQFEPWVERVRGQIVAAVSGLEAEAERHPALFDLGTLVGISAAVAWYFLDAMLPELTAALVCPSLRALSSKAEQTPSFRRYPHAGPGVPVR